MSVHPSMFLFKDDNLSKCQWIATKLGLCIDIMEVLGLLVGKFCQVLTKTSARNMSVFSFPDDNLSKCQRIFT